jgi:signal transduction histidine kinase
LLQPRDEDSISSLWSLIRASAALVEERPLSERLTLILDLSHQLIEADAYAAWVLDRNRDEWSIVVSRGLSEAFVEERLSRGANSGPGTLEQMTVEDVDEDPRVAARRQLYNREGISSLIVQPMSWAGEVRGTLVLYYKYRQKASREVLQTAEALANLAAAAINASDLAEEEEESRQRLKLLADAGEVLSSSLDYEETLKNVARLCVPVLADWCAIDILEDDELQRVTVHHRDPAKVALAEELRRQNAASRGLMGRRDLSGLESRLFREIPWEAIEGTLEPERLRVIRGLGLRSAMSVPIRTRSQVLGLLTLVWAETDRRYREVDLATAEELGRRAGTAIENARLYRASEIVQRELKQANRAKDEFLAMISHELRSPVTTLYGGSLMLRRPGSVPEETRSKLLDDVVSEAGRLNRLIDNLLLIARLDLSQEIEQRPVDLAAVVAAAVETLGRRSPHREVKTSFAERIIALGEETLLEQVVHNLLENADKYSPPGTPVEVSVAPVRQEIHLVVRDRGPGVAPEELNLIFDSFYRSQAARETTPGKGLGLALCKRVVGTLGGHIWASNRRGGGLEVGFALQRGPDTHESAEYET